MRPLVLDEKALKALATLRAHAEQHEITAKEMIAIRNGKAPSVGLRPAYRRLIPFGYQVVYSVEHHPQPSGDTRRFRHASFSVQDTQSGKPPVKDGVAARRTAQMPNPAAVEELISHLGFTRPMEECLLRIEDGYAINVLEPLEP